MMRAAARTNTHGVILPQKNQLYRPGSPKRNAPGERYAVWERDRRGAPAVEVDRPVKPAAGEEVGQLVGGYTGTEKTGAADGDDRERRTRIVETGDRYPGGTNADAGIVGCNGLSRQEQRIESADGGGGCGAVFGATAAPDRLLCFAPGPRLTVGSGRTPAA